MAIFVDRIPPSDSTANPLTITLLHGFTQNSRCWAPFDHALARHLGPSTALELVDLPGHGKSHHDDDGLDDAAKRCLSATTGEIWIGYSMGGRVALHMALAEPHRCRALILIGAHPGIRSEREREARRLIDAERATHVEAVGTTTFVDEWLALPLFAGLTDETAHRHARYTNRAAGLAGSLRNCSTGVQRSLWEDAKTIVTPVLYLAGQNDAKFVELGREFVGYLNDRGRFATISGAGHCCHLEQVEETAATIATFVASHL